MTSLKIHIKYKHPKPVLESIKTKRPTLPCFYCEKKFRTQDNREAHTKLIHEGVTIGTKIVKFKNKLHPNASNYGFCDICERVFSFHLKRHIETKHSGNQSCTECTQKFNTKPELNKHYRSDHETVKIVKPINCLIQSCTRTFNDHSNEYKHYTIKHPKFDVEGLKQDRKNKKDDLKANENVSNQIDTEKDASNISKTT